MTYVFYEIFKTKHSHVMTTPEAARPINHGSILGGAKDFPFTKSFRLALKGIQLHTQRILMAFP
jgi:hypothetical protein